MMASPSQAPHGNRAPIARLKARGVGLQSSPTVMAPHGVWASSGLTDIHHQGHSPGKDVRNGDHRTEEAPSSSVIHISEPTRQAEISYAVFCLKKKKKK